MDTFCIITTRTCSLQLSTFLHRSQIVAVVIVPYLDAAITSPGYQPRAGNMVHISYLSRTKN